MPKATKKLVGFLVPALITPKAGQVRARMQLKQLGPLPARARSRQGRLAKLFAELLGKGVSPERLVDNLAAYQVIFCEIQKLRELDLSDVQPAVVFGVASLFEIGQP